LNEPVPPIIQAQKVSKRFLLRHNRAGELKVRFLSLFDRHKREVVEEFWALKDISLQIGRGEAVGLIGRNGSGKSTFLKLVAAIDRPTTGRLLVARKARIGTIIELGVGFHGELTGQENVFLNAAIHGLARPEIEAIYDAVVEYSGLRHFMDVPLKNYSSGMHLRLGFAIAANFNPDLLLLDEIFAVGDEDFQKRCMKTLERFQADGKTLIFVSHAPAAIRAICRRACLLDQGELLYDGQVEGGLSHYQRLIAAGAREVRAPLPPAELGTDAALAGADAMDRAWHRTAVGGKWEEAGEWQFEFLRRQGLQSHHFVLDVGCGSLAGARHLLPYMDQSHYWGYELVRDLFEAGVEVELKRANVRPERGHFMINDTFDFSECPYRFDVAIADSFFRRLSMNRIARCVTSVLKHLRPGGRFFATWLENPDSRNLEPLRHSDGLVSYPDREPYHYSFDMLVTLCGALGAHAERLTEPAHPRSEAVLVITPRT
jgi:ABC-type polysaccharide/polyol phosphate transport system ATPase subunit/SAM-dependent methyltransferase